MYSSGVIIRITLVLDPRQDSQYIEPSRVYSPQANIIWLSSSSEPVIIIIINNNYLVVIIIFTSSEALHNTSVHAICITCIFLLSGRWTQINIIYIADTEVRRSCSRKYSMVLSGIVVTCLRDCLQIGNFCFNHLYTNTDKPTSFTSSMPPI